MLPPWCGDAAELLCYRTRMAFEVHYSDKPEAVPVYS